MKKVRMKKETRQLFFAAASAAAVYFICTWFFSPSKTENYLTLSRVAMANKSRVCYPGNKLGTNSPYCETIGYSF